MVKKVTIPKSYAMVKKIYTDSQCSDGHIHVIFVKYGPINSITNIESLLNFKFSDISHLAVYVAEFMLLIIQEDSQFLLKIFWTDESKFSREFSLGERLKFWYQLHGAHCSHVVYLECRISEDRWLMTLGGGLRGDLT